MNGTRRYIDAGRIVTTGGISAGIDGSFHVVTRLYGEKVAEQVATYMEYDLTLLPNRAITPSSTAKV